MYRFACPTPFCADIMSLLFSGDRVRVKWHGDGKYYDAQIISLEASGYVVRYLQNDEIGSEVQEDDIIRPQSYVLHCPNPSCKAKLASNFWWLNVPPDEPNIVCCAACIRKYMEWTDYHEYHKRGGNKPYTWRQSNKR